MKRFNVLVKGILLRTVVVDTTDEKEGLEIVKKMYKNCEVVLDTEQ